MSYIVFTDACSNLPSALVKARDIRLLPCAYEMDGVPGVYSGDLDAFDSHAFYDKLRAGSSLKTSLLNASLFSEQFRPALAEGLDVVYVGLSSGVSGTLQNARIAAAELMEEFPGRTVRVVDSLGAGLGVGLLTLRAADLRDAGLCAAAAGEVLDVEVSRLLQFFTVDDLNFLKRTGRVSGATAAIGTVLGIKPLLWGDPTGHIVAYKKLRGRMNAIKAIVEQYREKAVDARDQIVAISHGDCLEEAKILAEMVRKVAKPRELIIAPHEPFTGAHVGPGMLALFFFGAERV